VNGLEHVCTLHVCRATDEIFFFLKMMKYFIIIISTEFVWFKNNNYSLLLNWLFVAFLWLFGLRFWLISVRKSLVVLPCGRQNFS
jgi:hypothetical protein